MNGQSNALNSLFRKFNSEQIPFNPQSLKTTENIKAFSLLEVLVVIAVISLLMGILMPTLAIVRARSYQVVCQSNIRQPFLANSGYANEHNGRYVPGALDIYTDNKHRWYGVRDNTNEPFDPAKGPLAPYLGNDSVKCPANPDFVSLTPSDSKYDAGSGGYGYNMIYIGSKIWIDGYDDLSCKTTAKEINIGQSAQTLMFADTAMAKPGFYIEYSFAEPRYFVVDGKPVVDSGWNPSPSIHFRHRGQANIGWVDGHVSSEKMGKYDGINPDGVSPTDMDLGWFEPMDNTLFDLK